MKLTDKTDLSRWNRAGLSEFRYLDGNAITYLETLRQKLVEQFDSGDTVTWKALTEILPELANETRRQTNTRLSAQYYGDRRDYAWEILRTFSRSTHILGEYINAYANEAYLPTAVEWDNVRKQVAMLDYSPSPPASAETTIALLFKKGESGEVEKGFAVKNKPARGETTVIFETQEKLQGSFALNRLYLKNWNRNLEPLDKKNKPSDFQKNLTPFQIKEEMRISALLLKEATARRVLSPGKSKGNNKKLRFVLEDPAADINVGDVGVLATPKKGIPVKVAEVVKIKDTAENSFVELEYPANQNLSGFNLFNSTLYLQPEFVSSPLPNGPGSATLKSDTGFLENELVFVRRNGKWEAGRVVISELKHIQFKGFNTSPGLGDKIFRARTLKPQKHPEIDAGTGYLYLLANDYSGGKVIFVDENLKKVGTSSSLKKKTINNEGRIVNRKAGDKVYFRYLKRNFNKKIYYPDKKESIDLLKVGAANVSNINFSGKETDLESGQWALLDHPKTGQGAYRITEITQYEDDFSLKLEGSSKPVSLLRSAFKLSLKHNDFNVNKSGAWSIGASNNSVTVLELQDSALADDLTLGQTLICASDDLAVSVELNDILKDKEATKLHVSPPFHLAFSSGTRANPFTRNNTLIYANVVRATHGETQPEKIVGNGDASQTSQCFALASDSISWVADAAFSTGVRADLTLRVGQRVWQQVQDLSLSKPEDHHYQVKVDQDNKLLLCFGDARHGRRLPTGIDNVRVRFRNGYGEEGNLEANALLKIAKPDPLLEDFVAPIAASGGAQKESSGSMRETAPATVLALKRAVSIDDFTHLAAHHSMVWQARAFEKMPGRPGRSLIEVVVVAAGGAMFVAGSNTANLIRNFLVKHAAPGTPVSVVSYKKVLMQLKLFIMVDTAAFDKKQVELAVQQHIQAQLVIKKRNLGQALFRNEIIALLEQVSGVENGHCEIMQSPYKGSVNTPRLHKGEDGKIRKISIKPDQLIYLDSKKYPLQITIQEYEK